MRHDLDCLKGCLALLIFDSSPSWIVDGARIKKKDLNVMDIYRFGFMSSNLMLSQNESVLAITGGIDWHHH